MSVRKALKLLHRDEGIPYGEYLGDSFKIPKSKSRLRHVLRGAHCHRRLAKLVVQWFRG